MARRTGVFVQMQREAARRQRERQRAEAAYVRLQLQARREADRAHRESIRLSEQRAKADARAQAEADKQEKLAYVEARQADVSAQNADLAAAINDLEQLLSATLEIDDFIDFGALKRTAEYPRFNPGRLSHALQQPPPKQMPTEPQFAQFAPAPPTGMSKLLGGKNKHAQAMIAAQERFTQVHNQWQQQVVTLQQENAQALLNYQRMEHDRLAKLAAAKQQYQSECAEQQREVDEHNAEVDALADGFKKGDPQAILEYFNLVLANSDYPESFPQSYRLAYVPESRQLVVEYELPAMDCVPAVREFRYVKVRDEISTLNRTAKDIRSLYGSVVAQVTLRTLHEVFEADRSGLVETAVFNGLVKTTDPGTGKPISPCLVTVRTTREVFEGFDLAQVDPLACLDRLNASVSKKPGDLAPVRPVLEFDMVDKRFIEETDVLSGLDKRPNLMDLTPTEFESLIQNLFSKMGLDTKQTRASRDGGVDCVAFDPRPIFGGKVVIQAKRYRNTVDVSAVRDLFGTMQNEGASKGILVTTSGYGQASYQFAENKPLELIDGSNLLYLLAEHADLEAKIVMPDKA
jgi:restriction system protein